MILSLLFIGGIERNPGPSSSSSDDSISFLSTTEHIIENKFSIVHYKVQSIANKMDLIQSERCNFDVICITESWLDGRTSDDDIKIENFKLFRRDRPGDHHGGIWVYVRNNVFFKKKTRYWATKHWVPLGRNFYQKQNTTHRYVLQTPQFNKCNLNINRRFNRTCFWNQHLQYFNNRWLQPWYSKRQLEPKNKRFMPAVQFWTDY